MPISTLSRPARLFLMERLERLHQALENLGQRLRDGIAHLVGTHVGDAIRDTLAGLLRNGAPPHTGASYPEPEPACYPHEYAPSDDRHQGFWHDPVPAPPEP